jgi:hypothetical protein
MATFKSVRDNGRWPGSSLHPGTFRVRGEAYKPGWSATESGNQWRNRLYFPALRCRCMRATCLNQAPTCAWYRMLLGYVDLSTTLKSVTHCSSCILVFISSRAGIQHELSENAPGYAYTELKRPAFGGLQ